MKSPSWTLIYISTPPGARWVGLAWEFFDEEEDARARYEQLCADDRGPTMRRYSSRFDRANLGGVHHLHGEG